MRTMVLSDVHMGPPGPRTTFREAEALIDLLGWVRRGPTTELVLAGDLLDFLLVAEGTDYAPERAVDRLEALAEQGSDTARVLEALAAVAASGHRLVVLAGNHDAELALPAVREEIERRLVTEVLWADDAPLADGLHGHAVQDGACWIVHGDRWDPDNRVDRPTAAAGTLALPAGSRLVVEVLNEVKLRHPWIDELKPEFPAVLLLLLYLDPRRTMAYLARHHRIERDLLVGRTMAAARRSLGRLGDEAPAQADLAGRLASSLGPELTSPGDRAALEEWLRRGPPAAGTLAIGGLGKKLLTAWLAEIDRTPWDEAVHAPDVLPSLARPLPVGVATLIAGHSHGPRDLMVDGLRYLNTGTWLPVTRLPAPDRTEAWLDDLELGRRPPSSTPRTFALVDEGGVRLLRWSDAGAPEEV